MRTTAKCSLVSLRGHALKRPFTVSYKRADVTIPSSGEIHFINVVRPGTQFELANLSNNLKQHSVKLLTKSGHVLWRYCDDSLGYMFGEGLSHRVYGCFHC